MIFVTGVGRCGTSTVARVIHQNNVACMGHRFSVADKHNIDGYWEDLDIAESGVPPVHPYFYTLLRTIHGSYGCTRPIGYKHPRLVDLVSRDEWLQLMPRAVFVCVRSKEKVIRSMMRKSGNSKSVVESFYRFRKRNLNKNLINLPFVYTIDMDHMRSDEWVLNQILLHL